MVHNHLLGSCRPDGPQDGRTLSTEAGIGTGPDAGTRRDAASEAWTAMVRMMRSDENQRRFERAAAAEDLTPRQLGALLSLPDEPAPMSRLAERCKTSASFMTSIVDVLEEQGLVERRADPDDRRVTLVALTRAGRECLGRSHRRLAEPPSGFDALTDEEARTLRDLMVRVAAPYQWGTAEPARPDP